MLVRGWVGRAKCNGAQKQLSKRERGRGFGVMLHAA